MSALEVVDVRAQAGDVEDNSGWRYQHIERLGHAAVDGLLDGEVVVQTKIDGANLSVWIDDEGLRIASRNRIISTNGSPAEGFNGAIDYILTAPGVIAAAAQYILRGEWLVKHSISYGAEHMRKFYVFDCQRYADHSYVHPDEYVPLLRDLHVCMIPERGRLARPTVEQVIELMQRPDELGTVQSEGVVVKRCDFVNRFGNVTWGKVVAQEFRERNKLAFGGAKDDPVELRLASDVVTKTLVNKTIDKVRDMRGEVSVRNMGEILGRVLADVKSEEFWPWCDERKVAAIDLRQLRALCERKARDIALDRFNGVTTGTEQGIGR